MRVEIFYTYINVNLINTKIYMDIDCLGRYNV